ncbi:hypothetical protein O3P69_011445 [Scylla paramamosain]|uniref:Uncharacterized protein n=1 Tax=Scylla paramamosain TaxID=85552 RepID=A0AAW0T5R1_SCYPA
MLATPTSILLRGNWDVMVSDSVLTSLPVAPLRSCQLALGCVLAAQTGDNFISACIQRLVGVSLVTTASILPHVADHVLLASLSHRPLTTVNQEVVGVWSSTEHLNNKHNSHGGGLRGVPEEDAGRDDDEEWRSG